MNLKVLVFVVLLFNRLVFRAVLGSQHIEGGGTGIFEIPPPLTHGLPPRYQHP